MIPSLEDVSRITWLRIYGRPVSGYTYPYPCYHELAERLLDLPVERRSSLVPRVALQESLGLYDAWKNAGESEDEYLERLARVSRRELPSEPGPQADLDLRRFLVLFLGRLLFATRGDAVHCRFLPLLEDLGEVGGYAWGAAFLAHQYDGLSASEWQTSTSGFYPFLQVWAYLHFPALGRGDLARSGLVPIARRWESRRDTRHLVDQLERLQEAIDSYPYLDVIWQPYLGEGSKGQPWLVQARPYFGRSVWLHALNLVLPLNLYLTQRSLGLRHSVVEFPVRDRFTRPGRSFRGLHDTTNWRERAREQIENWERKGKAAKSDATTDDAYLQAYALKYGGKVYKSARHQSELEKVKSTGAGGASSSRGAGGSPSLLEAQLTGAVLRAEEAQRHLEERERDLRLTTEHAMDLQAQRDQYQGKRDHLQREIQSTRSERDQLRIRAEPAEARSAAATGERDQLRIRADAAEARVAEMTRELVTLRVHGPSADREEVEQLRVALQAQEAVARSLQ
ncbi:hypothetical protein Taro_045827 [Colocasia esculenta]|uniref:Aminotransferase-like plant mobile domain-containing protein n=1 Tax=Colocasia esculenta TaxID=4460 RepID=A0A843WS93_COLES|nr:hypothetical protein [Colocasia esculenta]